ncbi:MAG TPA: hypothetical protein VIV60_00760 [Polyangiaceae bacterium]
MASSLSNCSVGASATVRRRAGEEALNQLAEATSRLRSLLGELAQRLDPILGPEEVAKDSLGVPCVSMPAYFGEIRRYAADLEDQAGTLSSLLFRLEL